MYHHTTACLLETVTRTGRGRPSANRVLHVNQPIAQPTQEPPADTDIRHELVARVRREIAAGTYDTPEKLERALEQMLEDIG